MHIDCTAIVHIYRNKVILFVQVNDSLDDSISMLIRIMGMSRGVSMPVLASFRQLNENVVTVTHDWSQNIPITAQEVKCQVISLY